MPRGYRGIVAAAIGLSSLALILTMSLALYPEKPNISGEIGYQEQVKGYYPGGSDCNPAKLERPSNGERSENRITCQEAAEQSRLARNDLIQQRRSADAADAMAISAYQQTRIAAWGNLLGGITMVAAIAAAYYAGMAALHSEKAKEAFIEAERAILRVAGAGHLTVEGGDKPIVMFGVLFKNIGRTAARVTSFGSVSGQKATRWIDIASGVEGVVPGDALPDDRSVVIDDHFMIEYDTIGGKKGKSNFRLVVEWRAKDAHSPPEWVFDVFGSDGHADDT